MVNQDEEKDGDKCQKRERQCQKDHKYREETPGATFPENSLESKTTDRHLKSREAASSDKLTARNTVGCNLFLQILKAIAGYQQNANMQPS